MKSRNMLVDEHENENDARGRVSVAGETDFWPGIGGRQRVIGWSWAENRAEYSWARMKSQNMLADEHENENDPRGRASAVARIAGPGCITRYTISPPNHTTSPSSYTPPPPNHFHLLTVFPRSAFEGPLSKKETPAQKAKCECPRRSHRQLAICAVVNPGGMSGW